ncbi:isochorismatase family protein [Oxalobacteraceae bacterium CAVE-383]|nr:isochorismatase family protein [Oxalobacteraceae bacterium CAVE-383]
MNKSTTVQQKAQTIMQRARAFAPAGLAAAMALSLSACAGDPAAMQSANTLPAIPAPVPVTLDAGSTALLILDINDVVCRPNPACTATLPAISALLNKARAAKVPVLYSSTANADGAIPTLAEVAPRSGEPVVVARANKFVGTDLEEQLKKRKIATVVVVGSAANGAVMYTSFHANTRGFTSVIAEDGLSSPKAINTVLARYQLLNQPGFYNSDNTPLADKKATLSRSDLITFK